MYEVKEGSQNKRVKRFLFPFFCRWGLRGVDVYLDDQGKGDGPTQE